MTGKLEETELVVSLKESNEHPKSRRFSKLGTPIPNSRRNSHVSNRFVEHLKIPSKIEIRSEREVQCEKLHKVWLNLKGYILTLVFSLCSCISSILVRKSFIMSGADAAAIRYSVQFVIMFIIAKSNKLNPLGDKAERKLLTYRGLAGVTSLIFGYFAIKYINPSDFKAINHSSIIITAILARVFLKEKLGIAHIFALILTIAGVLLISQPTFIKSLFIAKAMNGTQNGTFMAMNETSEEAPAGSVPGYYLIIGIIFSIIAAIGGGSARVVLKKLCTNEVHFSVATIYASYYGLPVSLAISAILIATGVSHTNVREELVHLPQHLLYTFSAAVIGCIGQCVLNIALKYEDASKLAIVKTIDVFYAFILQYLFLNIQADMFSIIGACTIVTGAFLVLIFKITENKRRKMEKRLSMIKIRRISFGH